MRGSGPVCSVSIVSRYVWLTREISMEAEAIAGA
jgi:hypothetical protein